MTKALSSLNAYIEKAMKEQRLNSYRKLAEAVGVTNTTIVAWRKGKSWPSGDHMEILAELARADIDAALMELQIWSNEGHVKARWVALAERLAAAAAAIFGLSILAFSGDAQAAIYTTGQIGNKVTTTLDTLYIMANRVKTYIATRYQQLIAHMAQLQNA